MSRRGDSAVGQCRSSAPSTSPVGQLPQIVGKAALGLSNANLAVLNGAAGLSEQASGLVAQAKAIFDTLHGGVIDYGDDFDDGHSAAPVDGNSASGSSQQPTRSRRETVSSQRDSKGPPRTFAQTGDRTTTKLGMHVYNRVKMLARYQGGRFVV
jgi:hypothetical protein